MLFLIEINEQVEAGCCGDISWDRTTIELKRVIGRHSACFNRKEEKEKGILINQIQRKAAEGMEKKKNMCKRMTCEEHVRKERKPCHEFRQTNQSRENFIDRSLTMFSAFRESLLISLPHLSENPVELEL